jgi:hypothetical protein
MGNSPRNNLERSDLLNREVLKFADPQREHFIVAQAPDERAIGIGENSRSCFGNWMKLRGPQINMKSELLFIAIRPNRE